MSEKREAPRSEQVRTRQAQEKTKRLKQATERAYKLVPTASARHQGYVPTRHKRASAQRRFNIALGMTGADLRRPTISLQIGRAHV